MRRRREAEGEGYDLDEEPTVELETTVELECHGLGEEDLLVEEVRPAVRQGDDQGPHEEEEDGPPPQAPPAPPREQAPCPPPPRGPLGGEQSGELAGCHRQEQDEEEEGDEAPDVSRMRRERGVLLDEVGTLRAKFELTLDLLRAAFRLHVGATWADVLERGEALGEGAACGGDGSALACAAGCSTGLVGQMQEGIEQLEEKVESQAAHIARLTELLQKQQQLLDVTAQQVDSQQEQNARQTGQVEELEANKNYQQETLLSQQRRLADLSAWCKDLSGAAAAKDARLREQGLRISSLEAALAEAQEALAAGAAAGEQQGAAFARLSEGSERVRAGSRAEIQELEDALGQHEDVVERMTVRRRRCG